jgi:GTP cyclohydrolase I
MLPVPSLDENKALRDGMVSLLKAAGEDPKREGLVKTPERFLRAFGFLTQGYRLSGAEAIRQATFSSKSEHMVLIRDIEFYSLCEHHLLPFFGRCHVGYIPNGRIVGLSKIPRVVDVFARRLQVQEHLTHQIGECIMDELKPHGVGVVMEANHLCMMMRGVEKQGGKTQTSAMFGHFLSNDATRKEFLQLVAAPRL